MTSAACADRDFSGLSTLADERLACAFGMDKMAKELMGRLSTGNPWADMAIGFVPGVGTAMSAYDTVRNGANGFNDLFHGRFKSALGNFGSAAFNAGTTALNALTFGVGGKAVGAVGKLIGRGAKALGFANTANNVSRMAGAARAFDGRVAGAIGRRLGGAAGGALASARIMNDPAAANMAKTFTGGGVGGWMVRHPFMSQTPISWAQGKMEGMTEGGAPAPQVQYRPAAAQGMNSMYGYANMTARGMRGSYLR